ncbi:MAG TPA: hypothetical protein VFT64_11710 [Rickettsiales bacterium]|nr:hypothetical protein [Rickettsiales bacterium]
MDIEANTAALKALVLNIVERGVTAAKRPSVRLQIDADVFENPERFVTKYQALRSEPDEETRRYLLGKEAETIRNFVESGEMRKVISDVIGTEAEERNGYTLPPLALSKRVDEFLEKNFRLEGVRTEQALPFATWEIKSEEGTFLARQEYSHSTYMTDRPWQLGIEQELSVLAGKGHSGASQVLEAAEHTRNLETVNLTHGQQRGGGQGKGAQR